MSRTPASFTQADVARIIRAARQAGAREAVVTLKDGTSVRIPLDDGVEIKIAPLAAQKEVVL